MGCRHVDPISILGAIKVGVGIVAGKSLAGLSKEIGQLFDATDKLRKKLQKKGHIFRRQPDSIWTDGHL